MKVSGESRDFFSDEGKGKKWKTKNWSQWFIKFKASENFLIILAFLKNVGNICFENNFEFEKISITYEIY